MDKLTTLNIRKNSNHATERTDPEKPLQFYENILHTVTQFHELQNTKFLTQLLNTTVCS